MFETSILEFVDNKGFSYEKCSHHGSRIKQGPDYKMLAYLRYIKAQGARIVLTELRAHAIILDGGVHGHKTRLPDM
jgi:hypothetical protein